MIKSQKLDFKNDFQIPTEKDWNAAVEKLLKGKDFEETLFSRTEEGLLVKPIYTSGEQPELNLGIKGSVRNWQIAQSLYAKNDTFNKTAIDVLSKGQTALNLDLDLVSQFGNNASHFPELMGNIHLTDYDAFFSLLEGIDLNKVPLLFDALNSGDRIFSWIEKCADQKVFDKKNISIGLGVDPISAALKYGGFYQPSDSLLKNYIPIFKQIDGYSTLDIFTIQTNLVHNAGGHKIDELSYFLSVAIIYINYLAKLGIAPNQTIPKFRVRVAVGNDQFLEIAKLRALRILWKNLCFAYEVDPEENDLKIDVDTSWRFLSTLDPWTNMLRATSAAFSAIVGGCNTLNVLPFDLALGQPDEFSLRQARNIQIVLAEESHLNKIIDPALGSGYLDKMTIDLAKQSWHAFQEIEKTGGILELIRNGKFQDGIAENAKKQVLDFESNKRKAIGTNIYSNPNEGKIEKAEKKISFESLSGDLAENIKPLIQSRVLEKTEQKIA